MTEERVNKKINQFALLDSENDSSNEDNIKVIEDKKVSKPTQTNQPTQITKEIKKNQYNSTNKNVNLISNKIEDDMFKQYYGKKSYTNNNKYRQNNYNKREDTEFKVVSKRREQEKKIYECNFKEFEENFDKIILPDYFRVLAHHNDDKSWEYNNYHNITTLKTWGNVITFLNTLNTVSGECKFTDFDLFLMKNEISPMWEDQENRNGSICSVKIDSVEEGYNIFKELLIHMVNHTVLKFNPSTWSSINGLSFSTKRLENINYDAHCVIIKLWFKINIINYGPIDKLLNDEVSKLISRYSVKLKAIKPEY
jgi:hypothetical protein